MRKILPLPDDDDIAAAVRSELVRAGVPGAHLGQALGWSQAGTGRRLRGEVPITAAELIRAAHYLGIRPGRLYAPEPAGTPKALPAAESVAS